MKAKIEIFKCMIICLISFREIQNEINVKIKNQSAEKVTAPRQ